MRRSRRRLAGLAGFAFVVNGFGQTPLACPSDDWEFPPPAGQSADAGALAFVCGSSAPPCPGISSVVLVNTGQAPMAYIAQAQWPGSGYVPGGLTGEPHQLVGVLAAGDRVDITSVYTGGTVAVLGSAYPFSDPAANMYASDEGTIRWPAGVAGSEGATQMYVAEIDVVPSCHVADVSW